MKQPPLLGVNCNDFSKLCREKREMLHLFWRLGKKAVPLHPNCYDCCPSMLSEVAVMPSAKTIIQYKRTTFLFTN